MTTPKHWKETDEEYQAAEKASFQWNQLEPRQHIRTLFLWGIEWERKRINELIGGEWEIVRKE